MSEGGHAFSRHYLSSVSILALLVAANAAAGRRAGAISGPPAIEALAGRLGVNVKMVASRQLSDETAAAGLPPSRCAGANFGHRSTAWAQRQRRRLLRIGGHLSGATTVIADTPPVSRRRQLVGVERGHARSKGLVGFQFPGASQGVTITSKAFAFLRAAMKRGGWSTPLSTQRPMNLAPSRIFGFSLP